jgi:hypothetical protein
MHYKGKYKFRSHETSNYLIEVVAKAGLTIDIIKLSCVFKKNFCKKKSEVVSMEKEKLI